MKLKTNDTIKILSGNDKGRTGKITKVFLSAGTVLVDGLNTYKKHIKAQNDQNQKGGIVTLSRPIKVSKVALVCPNCKKTTRIAMTTKNGVRSRVCKKCGKLIDKKPSKSKTTKTSKK